MKIYVAAKYPSKAIAERVAKTLEGDGHTITHKWWDVEESGTLQTMERANMRRYASDDLVGVITADAVVVLVPDEGGVGMWVEAGAALGRNIPTYFVGEDEGPPPRRSIFEVLGITASLDAARALLRSS